MKLPDDEKANIYGAGYVNGKKVLERVRERVEPLYIRWADATCYTKDHIQRNVSMELLSQILQIIDEEQKAGE